MGMKYIVVEVKTANRYKREWPIIFPDTMVHRQVADVIQNHLAVDHKQQDSRIIAAGFVSFFLVEKFTALVRVKRSILKVVAEKMKS